MIGYLTQDQIGKTVFRFSMRPTGEGKWTSGLFTSAMGVFLRLDSAFTHAPTWPECRPMAAKGLMETGKYNFSLIGFDIELEEMPLMQAITLIEANDDILFNN